MSRVMVDLFCGRGGWTKGFMAHGWHCVGIDLFPQPDYPGEFIQADIAQMYELPPADFYCCSSPCEQFSVHGMKHFHPNPKWPWLGIALFEHARQMLEATGKPYVMENVRAAQGFVGRSAYHCGPFHLWGDGVPWFWSEDVKSITKGFNIGGNLITAAMPIEERRKIRASLGSIYNTSSGSKERAKATAKAAEIPLQISSHIAQMAGAL